jgi:hypothetical protein
VASGSGAAAGGLVLGWVIRGLDFVGGKGLEEFFDVGVEE